MSKERRTSGAVELLEAQATRARRIVDIIARHPIVGAEEDFDPWTDRRVVRTRDAYEGVDATKGRWSTVFALRTTSEDFKAMPKAARGVLHDFGMGDTDDVVVRVRVDRVRPWDFDIAIRPPEITDEKIGVVLGSHPVDNGFIVPVYRGEEGPEIEEVRFVDFDSFAHTKSPRKVKGRAWRVRELYEGLSKQIHIPRSFGESYFENPVLMDITEGVNQWVAGMFDRRTRPEALRDTA